VISGAIAAGADAGSPYTVTVRASDGASSASESFNWVVTHVSLASPGPQTAADGQAVSLAVQGRDADSDAVTFSASGLPTGLSINGATGLISGTIAATADQTGPFTVTATDGAHPTSQTFLWTVTAVGETNPGAQTSTEGGSVTLPIAAVTGSGTLAYSASSLPTGLSINPTTGVISGVVAAGSAAAGPYSVTVAASNGTAAVSQAFAWTVNPMVSLTAPAAQSNAEGNVASLQLSASDPAGTLTYSAAGLPAGLTLNASTGLISGTIAAGAAINGPYMVAVTAGDGAYSATQTFTWTVTGSDETTPTMTNPGVQANVAGDPVSLAVTASNADGASLTYSAANLPDGLNIDSFRGVITGTVADDAIRSAPYIVTVTAADGNGLAASQTFNWFVNDSTMAAQGDAIAQKEGAGDQSFTVASFTDPDRNRQAADYTATINWGDGQTGPGEVDGANGSYTVTGDHLYLHPGSFSVQVAVTDPAGGAAASTATATVSTAPITAQGGFMDGPVAGTSSTLIVGTFTDANTYDAASSYTASINWGDGTAATTGTVDGAAGVFRILGSHAYAQDGYYTTTMTILDADGTSATAQSTVQVGDINAGQTNKLTVATFTSSDTNPADFSATIAWGDGNSSQGTVAGQNGVYTVSGWHDYAMPGGDMVQVTVAGPNNNSISASKSVLAAPPAATAYDGIQAATVGQSGGGAGPLAVLAGPLPGGADQPASAVLNTSAGPVTVGLQQVGNLYEVLANLPSQTAGLFADLTGFYNAANALVGATVSMVNAVGPVTMVGPTVVPGNSAYWYKFTLPTPTKTGDIGKNWTITVENGKLLHKRMVPDSDTGLVTCFQALVQFANDKPVDATITLKNWQNDVASEDPLMVHVVQVLVNDPANGAFHPSQALKDGTLPLKDPTQQGWEDHKVTFTAPTLVPDQSVSTLPIDSAPGEAPAMLWQAAVTLNGPDGNKYLGDIQVGFHQTVERTTDRSLDATTLVNSSLEGNTYLDSVAADRPWFVITDPNNPDVPAFVNGGKVKAGTATLITANDSPTFNPVIEYDAGHFKATSVQLTFTVNLSVAAQTTNNGGWTYPGKPSTHLFQEVYAAWSVNADGTIKITGSGDNRVATWKPDPKTAGVNPPKPNAWVLDVSPPTNEKGLLTQGRLANDAGDLKNITFAHYSRE
jgi:hypothetical protein